jgi:hypothetical protein
VCISKFSKFNFIPTRLSIPHAYLSNFDIK